MYELKQIYYKIYNLIQKVFCLRNKLANHGHETEH